jgi:4-amino-4-deoxy-L-arabinose transferase-like glycosyltransferase
LAVGGALLPLLLMAMDRQWGGSVPLGCLGCLVATAGLLELLGAFDVADLEKGESISWARLRPRLLALCSAGLAQYVALRLGVGGRLGHFWPLRLGLSPDTWQKVLAGLLVTGTFLWLVVATYRLGETCGIWGSDHRRLGERHGFWLVLLTTLLYLPLLGSYSLSDPWETHYGEVAREMLARDDWISTWWAQENWFFSKPVLDFWLQALSFSALGVGYQPDQMLAGAAHGDFPQPEWAARFPVFLLTLLGGYVLYKGAARGLGRRAALLGGVVLVTMPYWYLISHQTMTDMPYVAPLAGMLGLLLVGFFSDPEQKVRALPIAIRGRVFSVSVYHLLFTLVVLSVLPQVLYLLTRNFTWQLAAEPRFFFRPHPDGFLWGSGGGNCGLPGNVHCEPRVPLHPSFQPVHGALLWSALAALLLWMTRRERRVQRLAFLGAWWCLAVSAMAKGAPGLVLPLFVALLFAAATGRWRELGRMEFGGALLLVACLVLPWFVQMYARHGAEFTERLLVHDMYKRAFRHVHDTNSGDDVSFRYYVWQLGYGLFPWTGLGAAGLVWWLRLPTGPGRRAADTCSLCALWFISGFGLFTLSLTKFHHYVLPVVPAVAVLAGVMLDRYLDPRLLPRGRPLGRYLGGMLVAAALMLYGAMRLRPGALTGVLDGAELPRAAPWLGAVLGVAGLAMAVVVVRRLAPRAVLAQPNGERAVPSIGAEHASVMLGVFGLSAAATVALVGRDLVGARSGEVVGQARLMHLFTYNYDRPWPESLSFDAALVAFTAVATAACALLVLRRMSTHVLVLLLAVAVLWTAWGVNVYLVQASPHWGQRETVLEYYRRRSGPTEWFVAYQMNWKGENFYAGNRVPAFVRTGEEFTKWVKQERERGTRVMFFTTEHSRTNGLKNELGKVSKFEVLTTKELNNKFALVRAEL